MRKSKIVFGIIAAVVVLACLLCFIFLGDKEPQATTKDPDSNTVQSGTYEEDTISEETEDPMIESDEIPWYDEDDGKTMLYPTENYDDDWDTRPTEWYEIPIAETFIEDGQVYYIPVVDPNEDSYDPDAMVPPKETEPIEIGDDVTIRQAKKDPNEVIDRTIILDPSHPDVLAVEESSPMMSPEGVVYRNDKEISIEVADRLRGKTYTFTFGHITGKCNRFLYLDPKLKIDGEPESNIYFRFETPTGGGLDTCNMENPPGDMNNYSFFRTYDDGHVATFINNKNPGTIWFTQMPLNEPVYINVQAYHSISGLFASLRLTIAKAEDGTYSIVDLDNNDIFASGDYGVFTDAEIEHLMEMATKTYLDKESTGISIQTSENFKLTEENCLFEIRQPEEGLYFNQFVPYSGTNLTSYYADFGVPILTITVRSYGGVGMTMYFWVVEEPTATGHGTYQYLGRDFRNFKTIKELTGQGYTGNG